MQLLLLVYYERYCTTLMRGFLHFLWLNMVALVNACALIGRGRTIYVYLCIYMYICVFYTVYVVHTAYSMCSMCAIDISMRCVVLRRP